MSYEELRKHLVNKLILEKRICTKEVEKAFLDTPRELFVPDDAKKYAYLDSPLEIEKGQTISAPHMVAIMVEALDIKKDQKILEIGTGSGYHAAIVSHLVGENGHIYTVERHNELSKFAKENLKNAKIKNVTVETCDGSEGLEKYAPYDRIYVTCAAPDFPKPLIKQLKNHGKLMVPIGRMICELAVLEKIDNETKINYLCGCAFVPLIGKYGH